MMDQEPGLIESADDPQEQQIADGISDYIHGPARDQIAEAISGAEAVDETIAAVSYQILSQVAHQIEGSSPDMLTIDLVFPLAAETIDYLIDIAEAVGAPIKDSQEVRERSMIELVQLHMAAVQDDPEQKAIAQEMLAEFMEDGTYDQGIAFVNRKIKEEGGDPDQARAAGEQMAQPQQDPLSAGIQQGLMGGGYE